MSDPGECSADLVTALVEAWTEVLGVPATPESDFLALGGTSLNALMVVHSLIARIGQQRDGFEMAALQALFEQPTLGDMATHLNLLNTT